MTERSDTTTATVDASEQQQATIRWLESEFPGWTVSVDPGANLTGQLRPLWIARCPGHHPQAELSPAKLHTRLTEYLERRGEHTSLGN